MATSWLQLTENLTFVSEPAGTTIYPTDTASAVSTASVDREAWTSRGAGVQTDVTNTATGLDGPDPGHRHGGRHGRRLVHRAAHRVHARRRGAGQHAGRSRANTAANARLSAARSPASPAMAPARPCVGHGDASVSSWARAEAAQSFLVSGDDLAVSDGQRLRIRFYDRRRQPTSCDGIGLHQPPCTTPGTVGRRVGRHVPDLHPDPDRIGGGPTTHEAAAAITGQRVITDATAVLDVMRIPNNRRNRMPELLAH